MIGCQNSETGQNRLFWFSLSHWRASQPSAGALRCQVDPGILLWCEVQFTAPGTQAEQGGGWHGTCYCVGVRQKYIIRAQAQLQL